MLITAFIFHWNLVSFFLVRQCCCVGCISVLKCLKWFKLAGCNGRCKQAGADVLKNCKPGLHFSARKLKQCLIFSCIKYIFVYHMVRKASWMYRFLSNKVTETPCLYYMWISYADICSTPKGQLWVWEEKYPGIVVSVKYTNYILEE